MTNEEICAAIQAHPEYTTQYMGLLWSQCERWIKYVAAKHYYLSEWEDLLQAGYLGLHEAARRYDPTRGAGFLTYSEYWIRQNMQRGTVSPTWAISLDEPLTEDGDDDRYTLIPGDSIDPEESATDENTASILWDEVDKLDHEERELIIARYRNGKGLKEIAADRLESYSQTNEGLRRARLHLSRNPRLKALVDENYSYTSRLAYSSGRAAHARFEGSTVERLTEARSRATVNALRSQNTEDLRTIADLLNAQNSVEMWGIVNSVLRLQHPEPPEDRTDMLRIMQGTVHPEQVPHLLEICMKF